MKTVVISSGHGLLVRGASGILDEVNEARRMVEQIAEMLSRFGVNVTTFHDDYSTTQSENLETIVAFHNSQQRDLDVSIHFNAYVETESPMGTECLYLSESKLAGEVSAAVAACGFIDRGAKKRSDLYFLNNTDGPAILIEVCFVDSTVDADLYNERFRAVCLAIAQELAGETVIRQPMRLLIGKVSWFGGPDDSGVSASEGLAFIYSVDMAPHLFLDEQPPGTTGLARRLDPEQFYIAMRFDYDQTSKEALLDLMALVRSPKTGRAFWAYPSDWGPHEDTNRLADISPGLMEALGIETDDDVEVLFPVQREFIRAPV